jgi:hypothetical protein
MIAILLALLSIALCGASVAPIGVPNLSSFRYSYNFSTSPDRYTFHWNVTTTEIVGVMELESAQDLSQSWTGIGIGNSMLSAEFIVCHNLGNRSIELHEHVSVSSYAPPVHRYGEELMQSELGTVLNSRRQLCQFRRVLRTTSSDRRSFTPTQPMKLLWAYKSISGRNYAGKYLTYHGENRGAVTIQLNSGSVFETSVVSFTKMQIHGFGMLGVWFVIFPFGAYYARYCRSVSGWILLKILNQTVGILVFIGLFFLILTNEPGFDKLHSFFGVAIGVVVFLQLIFGVATALGLSNEALYRFKVFSRIVHRTTGYGLIIFGTIQSGLGIDIMYPWVEPRTWVPWILYFFLIAFWSIAFGFSEWYFYTKVQREDPGYALVPTDVKIAEKSQLVKKFTWQSLNEDVQRGRMLVVANGKFVYDISQWIASHPGGQIILHSVCGTDITNDYFHEAGFDADEFTPRATPPKPREHKEVARRITRVEYLDISANRQSLDSVILPPSLQSSEAYVPAFSNEDWQAVQRARRTHVHTRLAVQKLASMVIGEIESKESTSTTTLAENVERTFDVYEYRRYALTSYVLESPPDATSPFVRLRFCLLYPFDTREHEPKQFLPGHSVEIEVRLPDGNRISRYYTPISGDMSAFELLIKIQPKGKMSQFLFKSNSGERQFKIRGPFGNPLLPTIQAPLTYDNFYSTIYFFAGGSGITPFLQLANYLLLPTNYRTRVPFGLT